MILLCWSLPFVSCAKQCAHFLVPCERLLAHVCPNPFSCRTFTHHVICAAAHTIFIRNTQIGLNSLWNFLDAKLRVRSNRGSGALMVWQCGSFKINSVRVLLWKWKKATGEYVMIITTGISTQSTHSLHLTSTKKNTQPFYSVVGANRAKSNTSIYKIISILILSHFFRV